MEVKNALFGTGLPLFNWVNESEEEKKGKR